MDWMLCVDETGDFNAGGNVAVVGVLIEHGGIGARIEAEVRPRIERTLPWFDWPFHSRVTLDVAANLIRAGLCRTRAEGDSLGQELLACAADVEAAPPSRWQDAVQRFRDGREPSKNLLGQINADLLSGPFRERVLRLRALLAQRHLHMRREVAAGLAAAPVPESIVLAAAMETTAGDQQTQPDRYLALLGHAVRRAVSLLLMGTGPSEQRLLVSPLQRHVNHPVLGSGREMTRDVVHGCIRSALGGQDTATHDGRQVRVMVGKLHGFQQADLPVGHALADLYAMEVCALATDRLQPWPALARRLECALHVPVEHAGTEKLPGLAATCGAESPPFWTGTAPATAGRPAGWPGEQAACWDAVALSGRST